MDWHKVLVARARWQATLQAVDGKARLFFIAETADSPEMRERGEELEVALALFQDASDELREVSAQWAERRRVAKG